MKYAKKSLFFVKIFIIFVSVFIASGCSLLPQAYIELPADKAQLSTHSALMSIDGSVPDNKFIVEIKPGEHTFQVRYLALLHDYQCDFNFNAKGGMYYEVVEHFNGEPLTLYRLNYSNWFWYQRVEPILPERCTEILDE